MADSDPRQLPSPTPRPDVLTGSDDASVALSLDRDARPLPPWKLRPDLSPTSAEWSSGSGSASMAAWRAAYTGLTPSEQDEYRRRYPAPVYWFWFWNAPGLARSMTVVLTFPLWMLVWAIVSTLRGAVARRRAP
ncbi:MAG: hypothetical protein KDA24_24075 [Deltaproteobacteria bacterium]|nr:hypothetical protein [Deltaproteobacteria bacterium]